MRKLLCALTLAALAATAQAVTVAWTAPDALPNGASDIPGKSYGAGSSYSVVAGFTLPSVTANTVLFAAGQKINFPGQTYRNWNNTLRVEFSANGTLSLIVKGASATKTQQLATGLTSGSQHTVAWSCERGTNAEASTITLYLDGKTVATVTPEASFWSGPANAVYAPDSSLIGDLTVYDGILTQKEGETWTVPEPTALALLALGVAGLALRRKAA